jgi:hypothetical protein
MAILGQEYLIRQRHVNFELAFTSRWKFLAQDIGHKGCGAAGELCKNPRGAIRIRILFFEHAPSMERQLDVQDLDAAARAGLSMVRQSIAGTGASTNWA